MTPLCEKCWGYHEPRSPCNGPRAVAVVTEADELRAEVDRLREEVASMSSDAVEGVATGIRLERARVVAWLREEDTDDIRDLAIWSEELADAIERGEHEEVDDG